MDQSFDKLRRKVLETVDEQRSKPAATHNARQQMLGEFIRLQLTKLELSEDKFAQLIHLPVEQVQRLLQGQLSEKTLTNDLLQHIALASQCDLNALCIILNRPLFSSNTNNSAKSSQKLS